MTTDDMFGAPAVMGVDWKELYGKLLAIFPYGRETAQTRFGETACVRADIYDLDIPAPVSLDALIFPKALVRQTAGVEPGKAVIGRLAQGEARGGQNAPWILTDPTPDDFERARVYFAAHKPRSAILREQRSPSYGQPAAQSGSRAFPPPPPGASPWQSSPSPQPPTQGQSDPSAPPF